MTERGPRNYYCGAMPGGATCVRPGDHVGPHIAVGAAPASCPDGCTPVDVPPAFGHVAPCDRCPHVQCAVCGTWAEAVSPAELAEAWSDMLASRPVKGQTSWL